MRTILAFCIGFIIGGLLIADCYKTDAVNKGYAEYNSKTGNWQWKE